MTLTYFTVRELHETECDTVIFNPPFGRKNISGIDGLFLEQALALSLHKTSTRQFSSAKRANGGVDVQVLAELGFDLPATYRFHRRKSVDVAVDFMPFEHKRIVTDYSGQPAASCCS